MNFYSEVERLAFPSALLTRGTPRCQLVFQFIQIQVMSSKKDYKTAITRRCLNKN